MARPKRTSDDTYNARRRYRRQAERYRKQAMQTEGETASKYNELARINAKKAIATYDDPTKATYSKSLEELSRDLDIPRAVKKPSKTLVSDLISQSKNELASIDESAKRENMAKTLLSGSLGRKVYGATVDIWQGSEDREAALLEHFGVDSMMDVIEILESQTDGDLYAPIENEYAYDEIRADLELALQENEE